MVFGHEAGGPRRRTAILRGSHGGKLSAAKAQDITPAGVPQRL